MTNDAFRYIESENHISDQNIDHLERIFELPIEEAAEALTNDELAENETEGLNK